MKPAALTLDAILIQDVANDKFTGYFKAMPEVIAEGSTEEETINNLAEALSFMFSIEAEESEGTSRYLKDGSFKINERNIQFSLD